jgi:hypothetical protein
MMRAWFGREGIPDGRGGGENGAGGSRAVGGAGVLARPGRRLAGVAIALVVGAAALGGCASARNELGTAESHCYIALPAAESAVHHRGVLHGVRLLTVTSLTSLKPRASLLYRAAKDAPGPKVTQVCLFAFGGDFKASDVEDPIGRNAGHLAVVELSYPGKRLLATLVARRVPLGFGHPHI